ncbi:MAG TPA: CocE/NonD family hydrolase [Acidimicrobiales bacterium]|nr:CocE/NonD family hydrolase [Acidimicrobiales bacterium]
MLAVAASLVLVPGADVARAAPNQFVTMADGVEIAVNVRLPDNYVAGQTYPTLFEMSGYDGGSAEDGTLSKDYAEQTGTTFFPLQEDSRQLSRRFNGEYVTVHASVRGTGCSGGEFDLFSWQAALDGKHIIDNWIPRQPWANGKVALIGHSYGGITGFMITATQPKNLRVASVSGLIDDLYRGITYPGGVSNYGFPLLWAGGIRMAYDELGGTAPGIVRPEEADDDPQRQERCAANAATQTRTVANDPIVNGTTDTDNAWWQSKSLITFAHLIDVPLHITGAYQDEQTGPRGPTHLFENVHRVPKRLVITNGDHNTQNPAYTGPEVWGDRKAWIDHWMDLARTPSFGGLGQKAASVTTLLEYHRSGGTLTSNARIDSASFPLETTTYKDWYLGAGNRLTTAGPGLVEAGDSFVAGSERQAWSYQAGPSFGPPFTTADGPDEVAYRSAPMADPTAIVGPITANVWLTSTAPDTELFLQLVDEGPDGSRTYLQRGLLRASHRAVDAAASDYFGGRLVRPHRPHTSAELIVPGQAYEYLVEVFPVGHVFRPGHRIVLKVTAPPAVDSYYAYVPKRAPAVNTVLHDAAHPSRLSLPVVPLAGVALGPALPCGAQEAVRCIARPNG